MKHSFLRSTLLSAVLLFPSVGAYSDGLSGAYLAARSASTAADFDEASTYFARAIALDPSNPFLLNNGAASFLSLGDLDNAVTIAKALEEQGAHSQIADLVLMIDDVLAGNYDAVTKRIKDGAQLGPVVTELIDAWATIGGGKMSDAIEKLDALGKQPGLAGISRYHKALALGSVGDFEAAAAIFEGINDKGFSHTRSTLIAYIEILSQLERNDEAVALLKKLYTNGTSDPEFDEVMARLEANETLPFSATPTAREGIAQSAFTLAEILAADGTPDQTILYSRMAEILNPELIPAVLLSAEMLEDMEQFNLATETYSKVPEGHALFHLAEIGRAETLRRSEKPEAAIEVLNALAKSHTNLPIVHVSLGDLLRSQEEYADAVVAYEKALDLFPNVDPDQWFIYYSLGICHERLDDFDAAESDFRKALELNPDQPQVLNYLGYSLIEKNLKLNEALAMIEKAVEARPEDGYIVDSLAWAYYKLERFDEAAKLMEKAAQLEPLDPIVSDHLGDALWMVGRKIEADFQWRRALSFEPEEEDAERIRLKLDVGLDVVREQEAQTAQD